MMALLHNSPPPRSIIDADTNVCYPPPMRAQATTVSSQTPVCHEERASLCAATSFPAAPKIAEPPGFNCTHHKNWCRPCELKTETKGAQQRRLPPLVTQLKQLATHGHTTPIPNRGRATDLLERYEPTG